MSTLAIDVRAAVDAETAVDHLVHFLAIDGVSGNEAGIAAAVIDTLKDLGVSASAIRFDSANQRIPMPTQTGNLFVDLPGTNGGARIAFATHLDTVPLCAGAKPMRDGDRIVNANPRGALGGDNRTGCAVLVALAEAIIKHHLPHPPIRLIFTVREESRLMGARHMDPADLRDVSMGFNVDSRVPADLVTGAVGGETWEVAISGKASHAGVAPEKGISSTLAAALAIAEAHRGGWFGKVVKPEGRGTSNVGVFAGRDKRSSAGDATNVVTDYVHIDGESRSENEAFTSAITAAYKKAFLAAAQHVTDDAGQPAQAEFESRADYFPFRLADDAPAVVHAKRAAESIGLKPTTLFSHGGLDANWFARNGLPTVTIGAGQHEIHTVKEFVDIPEFLDGCRLAVALATLDA